MNNRKNENSHTFWKRKDLFKRLTSLFMCFVLLTSWTLPSFSASVSDTLCDCGSSDILEYHADSCSLKTQCKSICDESAEDIFLQWSDFSAEMQEYILTYLSWTDSDKLDELNSLLEDNNPDKEEPGEGEEPGDGEKPGTGEQPGEGEEPGTGNDPDKEDPPAEEDNSNEVTVEGVTISTQSLEEGESLSVFIPEEAAAMGQEMGLDDFFIADISVPDHNGEVTLTMEIPGAGNSTDILHFLEDSAAITDDAKIWDISGFSSEIKALLSSAMDACYEATGEENCVAVDILEDLPVNDGKVSFTVDSFSIFAAGDVAVTTYEFYLDDELIHSQRLIADANGMDTLLQPESPYKEGHEFLGWKIEDSDEYQEFGQISVDTDSNTTIRLDATFDDVYYVYFLYQAKVDGDILDTLSGKTGDVIYTDQVDYPISLDKHIISWHTDVECESEEVTSVTIGTENITLYPKIQDGLWITFYTQGGNYIDPAFYAVDESISPPVDPQKTGYSFAGWTDADGNPFEFNGQILSHSIILYANWTPELVNYTVQIMSQNAANGEIYDPVASGLFTKQAPADSTVTGSTIGIDEIEACINALSSSSELKTYMQYFVLNETKTNAQSIKIAPDGSSVIYIYYDRSTVRFNFYLSDEQIEAGTPYFVLDKLFNDTLSLEEWITPPEEDYPNFSAWLLSNDRNTVVARLDAYNMDHAVFDGTRYVVDLIAYGNQSNTWYAWYYFQAINPDGTVPDVGYTLDQHVTFPDSVDILNPELAENAGNEALKKHWSTMEIDPDTGLVDDASVDGAWLLEDVFTYGSNYTVTNVADQYAGFTPVAFCPDLFNNVDDSTYSKGPYFRVSEWDNHGSSSNLMYFRGYLDDGTYKNYRYPGTNPLYTGKWYLVTDQIYMTFKGHLYIRYLRNQYDLVFKANGQTIDEFDVYYETDLGLDKFKGVENKLVAPEGYKFGGWFTSETFTEDTRYVLENHTMPSHDLVLYAKWIPTTVELDVHITIDGTDTIIDGTNGFTIKYGECVDRVLVEGLKESVNMPDGAIWYGWYEKVDVGGGKELLVPFNFDKQLIEDIVLYPFYSYMTPVTIRYDLNGGTGTLPVDTFNYALGRGAVVLSNEGVVPPDNMVFIGWNTRSDGSGKLYYPGDIALIDADEMTLYAQWGAVEDSITISFYGNLNDEFVSQNVMNNSELELAHPVTDNMFTDDIYSSPNYTFLYWNTEADGSGTSFNAGDTIVVTEDGENALYAIWESKYIDMLVTKELTAPAKEDQSFIFYVTGPSLTNMPVTVHIKEGETFGSVLLTEVIPGTYTVKEDDKWSWRYETNDGVTSQDMTLNVGSTHEFVFNNKREHTKWLSGDAYRKNKFK